MPNFPLNPSGYKYRALKKDCAPGWDVYALQTALNELAFAAGTADGYFGVRTDTATRAYQKSKSPALVVDGIAGVATQRALALDLIWPIQGHYGTPPGLLRGQVEIESGYWLGNHSVEYANGSYDCGVAQRNTAYTPRSEGFDSALSIEALASRLATKYATYRSWGKITDKRRLWELASGSWNRPAWTDTLAHGGTLTPSQSEWIEAYIDRATVYLEV